MNCIILLCRGNVVEDELHFLFVCEPYDAPRTVWLEEARRHCPHLQYLELEDQLKFIFNRFPRPNAKFIKACFDIHKAILYN